jgi:hypothetical protein
MSCGTSNQKAKKHMKEKRPKNRRVTTRFGAETKFELTPTPAAPFRAVQENRFEQLKTELLEERFGKVFEPQTAVNLRQAANEAAALAWITPYPLLVFPQLFEEKAESALAQAARQETVRERSRELLFV